MSRILTFWENIANGLFDVIPVAIENIEDRAHLFSCNEDLVSIPGNFFKFVFSTVEQNVLTFRGSITRGKINGLRPTESGEFKIGLLELVVMGREGSGILLNISKKRTIERNYTVEKYII